MTSFSQFPTFKATARRLFCGLAFLATTTAIAQAQNPGGANAPDDQWLLQTHDTKLGTLCMVGVRHGGVTLGFIAMKGRVEYRAFVNGLIENATRATWRVDDGQPMVFDGKPQRENRWVTETLRDEYLTHFSGGNELAVTSAKGERVIVGMANADNAVASFNACRSDGQPNRDMAQGSESSAGPDTTRPRPTELSDSERKAGQFVAALDALNVPASGERSGDENMSPRDVVIEAHQIYEEMLALPSTEEGIAKTWALEKRLDRVYGTAIGMRNSPDWEALFDTFTKQHHLLGQAISRKRSDISQTLRQQAPQQLEVLKEQADSFADQYASKMASFDVEAGVLDSVIVLRAALVGERPLAWLTARQWVALAMKQGVANYIDVQATVGGLAIVTKDTGKPSVTYLFSADYGELYLSAVKIGDQYVSAGNHQQRLRFETVLGEAVGYSRP